MRTLCITNDFPPRAGGIQAFVHGVLTRLGDIGVDLISVREVDAPKP